MIVMTPSLGTRPVFYPFAAEMLKALLKLHASGFKPQAGPLLLAAWNL
jgi:hypothetical protein